MGMIKTFTHEKFGQIRTFILPTGDVAFIGKDVATVLGYSNTRDALRKHVDEDDKTTVAICDGGSNYKTQAVLINESGLYALILSSKLPKAREFKHWVTAVVLPQIRKTGGYIPVTPEDDEKTTLCKALVIMKRTVDQQSELLDSQGRVIASLAPKAEYAEEVLLSPTCYTMTEVAKSLSMTVQELQERLHDLHVIYRSPSGIWMLYAEHLKQGLEAYRTKMCEDLYHRPDYTHTYLVWTEKGKEFIHGLFSQEIAA